MGLGHLGWSKGFLSVRERVSNAFGSRREMIRFFTSRCVHYWLQLPLEHAVSDL